MEDVQKVACSTFHRQNTHKQLRPPEAVLCQGHFPSLGRDKSGSGRKGGGSSLVSKDVKQVPPVKAQAFLYGVKGACTTPGS